VKLARFVDAPDPNLRHRANSADGRSGVALGAAEAVEHGSESFAGILHLQEVALANSEQLELVRGDAWKGIPRLRRTTLTGSRSSGGNRRLRSHGPGAVRSWKSAVLRQSQDGKLEYER
jgi:hypothetical protein